MPTLGILHYEPNVRRSKGYSYTFLKADGITVHYFKTKHGKCTQWA